jgi:hypothetical protein
VADAGVALGLRQGNKEREMRPRCNPVEQAEAQEPLVPVREAEERGVVEHPLHRRPIFQNTAKW